MKLLSALTAKQRLLCIAALIVLVGLVIWFAATPGFLIRQHDATWQRIQRERVVRVGLDATYPPYENTSPDGNYMGFDIDLAHALAQRWGVQTQFVQIHFDGLYNALEAGKCDLVISALPYDRTRTRDNNYSTPYFYLGQVLLVGGKTADIKGWSDLAAKRVAVELGSEAHQLVRQLARDSGQEVTLIAEREPAAALDALLAGSADALVVDRTSALGYLRQHSGIEQVGELRNQVPLVIAATIESGYTIGQVNEALDVFRQDGTLQRLEARWF